MTRSLRNLEVALGTVTAVVAAEHFFSTFLSSPWTTQKFVETEKEKRIVRKMYLLATLSSLTLAGAMSYLIKEKYPIYLTLILCLVYIYVYEASLAKKL